MNRNRRVKSRSTIAHLDPDSTDLFYESWVDDYYPCRIETLNNMSLYTFYRWFDKVYSKPKNPATEFYPIKNRQYIKKRKKPYLINHYKHNPEQHPENFFYSLLLMFKPWRCIDDLLGSHQCYKDAFYACKDELTEAIQYAEVQSAFKDNIDKAFELVEERVCEQHEDSIEEEGPNHPGEFDPDPVDNVVEDLRHINAEMPDAPDVTTMIEKLNDDQLRVFKFVTNSMSTPDKIVRHFVSGTGGTGKSFLISTIKAWVVQSLGRRVAISAPTGVAAFNVNGLTIYRLLQLPVEHGSIPKYTHLSDLVLQKFRAELKDIVLFIIDEVSMVSNLMLLYIHLRLTEIFGTADDTDGWFGKIHVLLFGDLLQLPPVHEQPPYIKLSAKDIEKYIGALHVSNPWVELFSYDELGINMRQKNNSDFVELLSRIRLGIITPNDIRFLEGRKLKFSSTSIAGRLEEVTSVLQTLPTDTVCLLPTRHMCLILNTSMLSTLSTADISLVAEDTIDCPRFLRKKVLQLLQDKVDDCSSTAGLEDVILVKVGAKLMLRRNIDVSLGLVNGAIGTLLGVNWDPEKPTRAMTLTIQFAHGLLHDLETVKSKFMVMSKAFVHRSQFPITVAYATTIHKSQGLSLNNVLLDIGSSVFSCGQAYVALSRVTTLEGLHIINFDPSQIKALDSAILEINRLRLNYRPDLECISNRKRRHKKVLDKKWILHKAVNDAQNYSDEPPPRKKRRKKRN